MKEFTIPDFVKHLGQLGSALPMVEHRALEHAAEIVEAEAKRVIGTHDYGWPPLAESTLARKSADTPLLETGEMLDSIEHVVHGSVAHVGSNNNKAVYHELGTAKIPARSFLMGAAVHKTKEVGKAVGREMLAHLEGRALPSP